MHSCRRLVGGLLKLKPRPTFLQQTAVPFHFTPATICPRSRVHTDSSSAAHNSKNPGEPSNNAQEGKNGGGTRSPSSSGAQGGPRGHGHNRSQDQGGRRPRPTTVTLLASGGMASVLIALSEPTRPRGGRQDDHQPNNETPQTDTRDPDKPRFRLSQIREHDASSDRPWVTRGDKVYDITDWIEAHPGGDVILRAAGGSIDPYWNIFTIHKTPYVYEILDQYMIGFIDAADLVNGHPPAESIEDPFRDDPTRDPRLITLTSKPRNAETPAAELAGSFVTPTELFYVRNHMWVPRVDDPAAHALTVELLDGTTKEYTLQELKDRFPSVKITATLQCSGNRRRDMTNHSARETQGLQWNVGAISCATWEGVKLADVLRDAGFPLDRAREGDTDARHVQFSGLESYGASIPLGPVLDPRGDVILAYAMNGAPLSPDHGYPLRALVPGHVAARSVKWLRKIAISDEESPSQWQRRDYKLFGPNVTKPDWEAAPAIQEMPITSAITAVQFGAWATPEKAAAATNPAPPDAADEASAPSRGPPGGVYKEDGEAGKGSTSTAAAANATTTTAPESPTPARDASVTGYAYSGGGRRIIRVDVSLDNGRTWDQAELVKDCGAPGPDLASQGNGHKSWAWQRWRYDGVVPLTEKADGGDTAADGNKRCSTLVVKATDEAYNAQPDGYDGIWNGRGNLANAWHRLQVCSECRGTEGKSEPGAEKE